jgi:hypothetical protein
MRTHATSGVILYIQNECMEEHNLILYVKTFLESEGAILEKELHSEPTSPNKWISFSCYKNYEKIQEDFCIKIKFIHDKITIDFAYLAGAMYLNTLEGKFKKHFLELGFSFKDYYCPY